jgi:hypothetical protein
MNKAEPIGALGQQVIGPAWMKQWLDVLNEVERAADQLPVAGKGMRGVPVSREANVMGVEEIAGVKEESHVGQAADTLHDETGQIIAIGSMKVIDGHAMPQRGQVPSCGIDSAAPAFRRWGMDKPCDVEIGEVWV